MTIYSYSKLSTYEKCPLKFKFRYIDRLKPEIKQFIEGFLGNQVHSSLEWLYQNIKAGKIPVLDELIKFYAEKWNKGYSKEIHIVKQIPADFYFNQGIKFLISYYLRNHPFDDNTIAIEKKIMIKLDDEAKYLLRGYIDRLVHNKDANILEIHDYKTSGTAKSREDIENDRQLALYCLGIMQEFQEADDIHLVWHFLNFDKKIISKKTEEQLKELRKELINLIDNIESAKTFPANPGILCNWCEFKNQCTYYNSKG